MLDDTPQTVKVKSNEVVTVEFRNAPKGNLIIVKQDSVTKEPLEGVEFNLIKNTTPRNASSNDPFWEKAEIALDSALMLYLVSEAPPEEQNFEMLIYMMNFAEVREEDDQYRSPLDMLFRALEEEQPNHVAVKQFKAFKQAAGDVCSK